MEDLDLLELKGIDLDEQFKEYFGYDTMEKIKKEAEGYNCDVVVRETNQLQFDIDVPFSGFSDRISKFFNLLTKLQNKYGKENVTGESWQSKGGNSHAVITVAGNSFWEAEAIALQALGGSDPNREYAALQCMRSGSPHPVLLFRPKNAVIEEW